MTTITPTPLNRQELREAFEEWADSFFREHEAFPKLKRHNDGYHHGAVNSSWSAWQAAIKAYEEFNAK